MSQSKKITLIGSLLVFGFGLGLNANAAEEMEELVVTGSQIRGASISDALPVSVTRFAHRWRVDQ